jgi:guanosine-3',5'-bis(diphosphate) 3'-pyrophosphohydrolase
MGTSVEPQPVAPNPPGGAKLVESSFLAQENQLLTIVQQYMAPAEVEQVSLAFQLAQETCKDVHDSLSPTSIPPLEHALAVATILADMHIDAVGVAAGLLFEAVDAERLALERVERLLGPAIARVLGSMLRLNILERKKQAGAILARTVVEGESNREQKKRRNRENLRRLQAETVRKMFFAMAEDPRVVLLKLAYRLHAMRLIQAASYPVDHQDMLTMAQETREIYAPLAGRLGMARVESELEDLAFAILEPEKYEWIRNQVELESKQWRSYVDRVCTILREEMAKLGLRAEVSGRVKHLYSFYQKLKRTTGVSERLEDLQVADFSQIHDLIAFRILVESTPDCYLALGHVHSLWKPKEGRIKDFIANPKSNGYRALHTTVFCLDDQLVEIQIRTRAMHEMAEYGVAMHWHYKDVGDHASASARELLTWLRQLADWQRDLRSFATSDTEFIEAVKDDIFQEQIFVFTPKGEVKDLPIGSTPLDFAYRVHSKVGDRCAGARVTTEHGADRLVTRMVPLDYELRSGDIVDIVTNRTAHPTRDWLSFARTTAARSKIRRYLKIHERAINIQIGRERLERELKMMSARDDDILTEENQHWLAGEFRQATFEDLLAAIGSDEIRPHAAAVKLVDRWQHLHEQREGKDEKNGEALLPLPVAPKQVPSVRMQVAGVSGLLTRLANCCCPLPGDEIVGFISRGKGAIVHRADCKNIDRYRERERERLINVSWTSMGQQHYLAPITITARDRSGLIRDIAAVVSEAGVNMTTVNSYASVGKEVVLVNATLEIESLDQMQRLFARIEKVKNVLHVQRDLGKGRKA